MRGFGWVLALLLGLGAGAQPLCAQETSLPAEVAPVLPKIVLQALPTGGVEVAAWIDDDRHIVTANATSRTVLIWNAASGDIVDRLVLPSDNRDSQLAVRRLTGIDVDDDGQWVTIAGETASVSAEDSDAVTRPVAYRLDLATRRIGFQPRVVKRRLSTRDRAGAMIATNTALAALPTFEAIAGANSALETLLAGEADAAALAAAEAKLPALPAAKDGRKLRRTANGLAIDHPDGTKLEIERERTASFSDARMAPDGSLLALLEDGPPPAPGESPTTTFDVFNIESGSFYQAIPLAGAYSQVQWIDRETALVSQASYSDDRDESEAWAQGAPPPMILIAAASGTEIWRGESRCFVSVASETSEIYGAGLANCRASAGADKGLVRFDGEKQKWVPFGDLKIPKKATVELLAVGSTGKLLAVALREPDKAIELVALDAATGKVRARKMLPGGGFVSKLAPADTYIDVAANGAVATWMMDAPGGDWVELPLRSGVAKLVESDAKLIAVGGITDDVIGLYDMDTNEVLEPLDFSGAIAGEFMLDRPVLWALSALEGFRMWDTNTRRELLTVHFFAGGGFLAVTPEGRYDTNLGPDSPAFRWLVSDRPFQSLGPQTFMRDHFEPNLIARVAECSITEGCTSPFAPVRPIAELNRTLPRVEIESVVAGDSPDEAVVTITVANGFDPEAPAGKQHSGIFDVRLFRDYRIVAQLPEAGFKSDDDIAVWRQVNRIDDDDDNPGDGTVRLTARIALPTNRDAATATQIGAYAFHVDRIKSDTAFAFYTPPPSSAPRQKRAYIVAIGVDEYETKRLRLNYASGDARLMAERLSVIPGYDVRKLVLSAERDSGKEVTADTLRYALGLLGGILPREDTLAALRSRGIDGSPLETATPDDLVIVTFSGHGWTAEDDDFYLLASDAKWPDKDPRPNIESLISAEELSLYLRPIDAGEIAFVIDACQSGASVAKANFKPGPFGDSGLGQLAYDKGIRILVATQAGDVAMEDGRLQHGLLTFALAGKDEGLAKDDDTLDLNGDKQINLTEWLAYPTWRMLDFNEDKRVAGLTSEDSVTAFDFPGRAAVAVDKVQEPSLYDYAPTTTVVLKAVAR